MSVKVLKYYIEICNQLGTSPTYAGLSKFNEVVKNNIKQRNQGIY